MHEVYESQTLGRNCRKDHSLLSEYLGDILCLGLVQVNLYSRMIFSAFKEISNVVWFESLPSVFLLTQSENSSFWTVRARWPDKKEGGGRQKKIKKERKGVKEKGGGVGGGFKVQGKKEPQFLPSIGVWKQVDPHQGSPRSTSLLSLSLSLLVLTGLLLSHVEMFFEL